jgi:hypothetical protein
MHYTFVMGSRLRQIELNVEHRFIMKMKFVIIMVFIVSNTGLFAQIPAITPDVAQTKNKVEAAQNYQLFKTENIWTFIKLDTRNGKMWQVQYSVGKENRIESVLNSVALSSGIQELAGRFTLYPTANIYNFILLDQINGSVYQVQWSIKEENRGVIPIN